MLSRLAWYQTKMRFRLAHKQWDMPPTPKTCIQLIDIKQQIMNRRLLYNLTKLTHFRYSAFLQPYSRLLRLFTAM